MNWRDGEAMKYKLQLWDEDELAAEPIKEWIVGIDKDAEFNMTKKRPRELLAALIWHECAEEDVRASERAAERRLGDAWDGGFADNH